MGLRTIWYSCFTLPTFLTLAAVSQVPSGVSGTVGLQVTMFKIDQETRVVGSSVRVKSEIRNTTEIGAGISVQVELYATLNDESDVKIVAKPAYVWQSTSMDQPRPSNLDDLSLSFTYSEDLTRTIEWHFSDLPLEYDHLFLETKAYILSVTPIFSDNTTLYVSSCPSPHTVPTVNQNSSFNITANSVGHYNKTANCSCLHDGEVLFDIAGNRAIGKATCAINAKWVGCENLQCWSGPKNVSVTQVNMSANAVGPFKCSSDGFPNPEKEILKLNGKPIPDNYQLKSSDHGKNLSCQVVSPYTKKQSEIFESSPEKVVVYYKPENSTVSDDPAVIPMNSSKLLTYSVYANPLPNAGGLDVKVYNASGSEASSDIFSPVDNHTDDVNHGFEFNITVRSNNDYGKYKVCAFTKDPDGKDCADFSIRNAAVPTTQPDDVATFSTTTDLRNALNPGLPNTVIGAIIAGVILLLVLITVAGVCLWKKRNKAPPNEENSKEEKVNELYGVAQFHAPSTINPKKVKEVKPNVLYGSASGGASPHEDVVEYSMANDVHIGDENPASVTVQPCSSNTEVYAQIDRQKGSARDGCKVEEIKDNKPAASAVTSSTEQPCSSNTEVYAQIDRQKGSASDGCKVEIQDDGPAASAVTFTTVDKSKKQKKDNVPEIYAVINKPRKRA